MSRSCRAHVVCLPACDVCVLLSWTIQSKRMSPVLTVLLGLPCRRRPNPQGAPSLLRGFGGFTLLCSTSVFLCKQKRQSCTKITRAEKVEMRGLKVCCSCRFKCTYIKCLWERSPEWKWATWWGVCCQYVWINAANCYLFAWNEQSNFHFRDILEQQCGSCLKKLV